MSKWFNRLNRKNGKTILVNERGTLTLEENSPQWEEVMMSPNTEIVDEVFNIRMAGDHMRTALAGWGEQVPVLTPVDKRITPAPAYTGEMPASLVNASNMVDEFSRINQELIAAGVSPKALQGIDELQLRNLVTGAPAPYVTHKKGVERRIHTRRDPNEITGREELSVFMDPSNPGEPLITKIGTTDLGSHTKASEYIQERALKLMGLPAQLNNKGKDRHYLTDFIVPTESGPRRIDGMTKSNDGQYRNTTPVPVYTALEPKNKNFRTTENDKKSIAREVNSLIRDHMMKTGGNVVSATENLLNTGVLGIADEQRRLGKLLRNDPNRMIHSDEVYDELLVTGYPGAEAFGVGEYNDVKTSAPTTIQLGDLSLAREYVEGLRTRSWNDTKNVFSVGSFGDVQSQGGRQGRLRAITKQSLQNNQTLNGQRIFEDVGKSNEYPHVAQLLRNLPYA